MTTSSAWQTYRLRIRRKRFLLRAWRKRSQLKTMMDRTGDIRPSDILCFATLRNELLRLPFFLDHHRKLGVRHFLIVDNGSDDGTTAFLENQPDVSLWRTVDSYKLSRFGMDWLTWLQMQYAAGHWCLTVDADEALIYPDWETQDLNALTAWLQTREVRSFGAIMLDMYPKGPLSQQPYAAGDDPTDALTWFDADNYRRTRNPKFQNEWIQGGVRDRVFFQDRPERAPTLNKVPLVHWKKSYAYVTSTHHMLPTKLNHVFDSQVDGLPSGVLLHSKFLNTIGEKSAEERQRREHFENSDLYADYYQSLINDIDLWYEGSTQYEGWEQLVACGLMSKGDWPD
ncbi:glycosyltransferase family 2 protein [Loktanella sp. F6476L]|uniref:glycosyltransferase family 2 protein n=1 Tax=Loktanella sp. F6476L TaxID=2926405 RepID=UPI001FF2474B|nr:glycosyltransferase family 2 protein [Loktanella sp. F6476L]